MEIIETKYFGYCKGRCILRPSPQRVSNPRNKTDYKFMKNNTIQVIAAAIATGALIGFGSMKLTGDYVLGAAAGIGYLTVAALVAMANIDYRRSQRSYTA